MKNKKILVVGIIILVIVVMSIIGGIGFVISNYAGNYQKSIYGDNSKIIDKADSYSYIYQVRNNINGILKSKFKLTGMDTVYKIDTESGGTISINYDVNITSGEFKVVLINPSDEVTNVIEGTDKGTKKIELSSGESRIKLVGKDAKGDIEISVEPKDDIEIEYISN